MRRARTRRIDRDAHATARLRAELEEAGRAFTIVRGSHEHRFSTAAGAPLITVDVIMIASPDRAIAPAPPADPCATCALPRAGPYCSQCGQPAQPGRLTTRDVFTRHVAGAIDLDRGMLHTAEVDQYEVPGLAYCPPQVGAAIGRLSEQLPLPHRSDAARAVTELVAAEALAVHREGSYANPGTRYWNTSVLRWLSMRTPRPSSGTNERGGTAMRIGLARWARHTGLAALIVASAAFGAAGPAHSAPVTLNASAPADVTAEDVAASNAKVAMAYGALVEMWAADFDRRGARFAPPGLVRYRGAVRTSCGVMSGNNAAYCTTRNTIYFDEIFLARQAKAAARDLGTDGDMAAVGIIAHEMGHAVAMQLGADSPVPYYNEATADCLAGAFTRRSARNGSLEPGDLDEAFHGLAAAGDPTPRLTGDRRIDRRIAYRAALMGHGTREQRLDNFTAGYERGAGACLPELEGG